MEMLKTFLWGLAVAGVCVGGLGAGMSLMMRTQKEAEQLSAASRRLRYLLASALLGGQLLLALYLLFRAEVSARTAPYLGLGLVGGTFLFSWLIKSKNDT